MHPDHLGHLPQCERLQVLDALLEELALPVHDEIHHLQHRLPPLLDRLDHPVGAVEALVDELLVLALVLPLVPRDVLVGLGDPQPWQPGVVQKDVVLVVDFLDHEVGDDVDIACGAELQPRLGVEFGNVVGRPLHLLRREAVPLADVAPAVRLEVLPGVLHEPVGKRVGALLVLELQQQALAQVARPHAGRVELLHDLQHLLRLGHGVVLHGELQLRLGGMLFQQLVRALDDLLQRGGQIAVLRDVAQELVAKQPLPWCEVQHLDLILQMVGEVLGLDRHRLDIFPRFAEVTGPGERISTVVEQDVFPVGFVVSLLLLFGLDLVGRGCLLFLLGFEQLEEGVAQQLLLEVLLQVEQGHVQQVHRLIEARIDAQVLPQRRVLVQARFHAACPRRARRRAVSVGPRYKSATLSLNTSSRTVPATWTLPSNMM